MLAQVLACDGLVGCVDRRQIDVIHPGELGPAEISLWHQMQNTTPSLANPFLSPEFAAAVGRHRGGARVAVLSDGSETVGFFPFERRRLGVGLPISGWLSACQGVVCWPSTQWSTHELLRGCGLSAWRFDNLLVGQKPFEAYHSAVTPSPVIKLGDGYLGNLRASAPRMCRELDRKSRKLSREFGALRLVCDSPDPALLRLLMSWKSGQYRRTQHVDRFANPWVAQLFEELHALRTDALSGVLSVLYAGDRPVSIQFGLRTGDLLVGWFTGYDVQFRKYSPGMMQVMMLAEALPAHGVREVHVGKGAARFTRAIKNSDFFVAEGTATTRTPMGRMHYLRSAAKCWALRTVRNHDVLHSTADVLLRRSRLSRFTYGRI